jgi:ribonuclease HII
MESPKNYQTELERHYDSTNKYELCIDEAGRGCLFGKVYIACVVLPKEPELFSSKDIKDSKKFSSKKKLSNVANYIKEHALAWHIACIDESIIDNINILQAVMQGMHICIREIISRLNSSPKDCMAIIDGNYFNPYCAFDNETESIYQMKHITIEKGDSKYMGIAAASILAKNARDSYIEDMCKQHPELVTRYAIDKNMGYGTKAHLEGIHKHGITEWHRRTFGCCKTSPTNNILQP